MLDQSLAEAKQLAEASDTQEERQTILHDILTWESRMLFFPALEKDRPGDDIITFTSDLRTNLMTLYARQLGQLPREVPPHPLFSMWLDLIYYPAAARAFDVDLATNSRLVAFMTWEEECEAFEMGLSPEVRERYLKLGRETIYTWGKKSQDSALAKVKKA